MLILTTLIIFTLIVLYLLNKIEKQKLKIIALTHKNEYILKSLNAKKTQRNKIDDFKNIEIKFLNIPSYTALLKNTSHIKIAPFDFAPKIIDIKKNTEIKILSKIIIGTDYWYEIIINNQDNSYKLKGWIKEDNIDLSYNSSNCLNLKTPENTNYTF